MSFVYPQFFWVMIIPFVIFAFLVTTNKEAVERIFSQKALSRLRADSETLPNSIRNLVLFSAVFAMIVALARPVIPKGEKTINLQGLKIVVALDISGSMRSKDVYPNRLEFAKKKIEEFLEYIPNDEVALSAFAKGAFVLSPFTSDKEALKQLILGVDDSYINMSATNLHSIIEQSTKLLKDEKEKIVVLFTDGGEKEALNGLKEELEAEHIKLFVVLVGTQKGAPVLNKEGKALTTKDGKIAITQINLALGELAKSSGGDFVIAQNGDIDMKTLAKKIHQKFKANTKGTIHIKERVELFYYPLIASVILLLIGLSSMPRSGSSFVRYKRKKR